MKRLKRLIYTLASHRMFLVLLLMVQFFALTSSAQTYVCKCGKDKASDRHKCCVTLEQKDDTLRVFCSCQCSKSVETSSKLKAATKETVFTKLKTSINKAVESVEWITILECLAAVFFAMWLFFKCRKFRQFIMKHLLPITIGVFVFGIVIYTIGFNWEGSKDNPVALLLRSITASMEMFVSESELIEVAETWKGDPCYMIIFAIIHFLAVCISAIFILHLIGIRAWSYLRMHWLFNIGKRKNQEMFIFFDLGNESMTLARSCKEEDNRHYKIIFVRTPISESHQERFSFSHILSFVDTKSGAIDDFLGMNALLCYSKKTLDIDDNGDDTGHKNDVGLSNLRQYIRKRAKKIHFFCLSQDEDRNISTAIALHKLYKDKKNTTIYCHARKNNAYAYLVDDKFKIIDSSSLSIQLLKDKDYGDNHPVSLLKKNGQVDTKSATVSGKFSAMIIGMGETGRDAFRFLYEYSALPTKDKKELLTEFYLVDKSESDMEYFKHEFPSVAENQGIHYLNMHTDSINFWDNIEKIKDELDCIYVTLGNNKIGIKVVTQLFDYLVEHEEDNSSHKLTIFLRVYENENYSQIKYIVKKLNDYKKNVQIIPFGSAHEIFSYDSIVQDKINKEAQMFKYVYHKTDKAYKTAKEKDKYDDNYYEREVEKAIAGYSDKGSKNGKGNNKKDSKGDDCNNDEKGDNDSNEKALLNDKWDSYRKAKQNIENSLHKYTILRLGGLGDYKDLTEPQKENLARCEHLRWVRSHEILGYSRYTGEDKTALHKKHYDMVNWEDIGAYKEDDKEKESYALQHKRYDYNVIIVSYHLYNRTAKNNENNK